MDKYNPKFIEKKWQTFWEENPDLYAAKDSSKKEKSFILDMFPYPSGAGLHIGHVESYTATDIISRYLRLNDRNVLHPQGWDAFGLPAENYAIKNKIHPKKTTKTAIKNFTRQIKSLGMSYDWSREINSSDPEYYKWTQWFFLTLYKNGLAYKKKAKVNWCDSCQTVLANEQVESGLCERCKNPVRQKDLEQWFFKITDFIEDKNKINKKSLTKKNIKTSGLLNGLNKIDWPNSTKILQKNWVGKSVGAQFKMKIEKTEEVIEVFTTRVDTVFGMTYAVLAPEHEIVGKLKDKIENYSEVEKYLQESKKKTDLDRMEAKDKTGVELEGIKVINPFNNKAIPLYVADYVLSQYGTGAVMAVPAHDERDFEFAKKFDLPIRQSIAPFFVGSKEDKTIDGKETIDRKGVDVILKHWDKDEYFCLEWNVKGWKSYIHGGIEKGENLEEAAIREAKEESGYKNMKVIGQIGGEIHSEFFATHKDINRRLIRNCVYIELIDGEHENPKEKDVKNHKGLWVKKDKVNQFINIAEQKIYWNILNGNEDIYTEEGVLIDSGKYSGLKSIEAREKMTAWLEKEKLGEKKINYRLRDWLISRQRYWGAPIPIIYCDKCGTIPVPEKDLPVKLPMDVDFKPTGESPLKYSKKFQNVKCPVCGKKARRESDTMDTFVCSSWYYFRYADPKNKKEFASKKMIKKWLPVDLYVGGAEHSVLHLLYARFFTKVLHNLGYIDFDEPFLKLRHQGIILSQDGRKMSKSLGNVINPDDEIKKWGADSLRLFEMFMGPLEDAKPWQTKGIVGVYRFLEKVWKLKQKVYQTENLKLSQETKRPKTQPKKLNSLLHKTIKKVTADIENFNFNTAVSQMMILANTMEKEKKLPADYYSNFLILLSPFAPHIAEELWNKLGHKKSIFREQWPKYNIRLIKNEEIELVVQINGRVRDKMKTSADISEDKAKRIALENKKIKKWIEHKKVKKIIFVKGKLINIVI